MSRDQVVIITQTDDPHADEVILALERIGHDAVRVNSDEVPSDATFFLRAGERRSGVDAGLEVLTNGRSFSAESVRSVWWRRPAAYGFPDELSIREREFATLETDHALRSLWASLDCYWVSHPDRIRAASWKGEQLVRAERMGFQVPKTLITTDPALARQFLESCADNKMVFKVMSDPYLGAEAVSQKAPEELVEALQAGTTLVDGSELDLLDSVRLVPCLFQEYVPKRSEYRVTYIAGELFVAEIDSQADESTALDWRHYDVDVPYSTGTLPAEVEKRCQDFVRSYGLNFSALDLIRTPDDDYVFVENNPNGQFIFVEDRVPELEMTDALASCLARGGGAH